jgi:Gpi18-like mannosyltransferase
MAKTFSKIRNILLLGLLLRLFLVIISGWHPDLLNHIDWGIRFLNLGPQKFYENIFWGVSWPNQPFGTMLLFAFSAICKNLIFGFIEFLNQSFSFFPSFIIPFIEANIHAWMVKFPFILADIGLGFLIYKIVIEFKPKLATLAASLFLFNPVLIYNSAIWGQTDSLINLLALSGIYLVFKKNYFSGVFLFLLTFIFKLSLIIYLPIFGLLFLKRLKDWYKFIIPFLFFLGFMYLLAIPFKLDGFSSFQWIWYMYTNRVLVRQGSMLNGNAFNLWSLIFGIDLSKSEFTIFHELTFQTWGRLIYLISLIPVWFKFIKSKLTLNSLIYALMISAFGCFIFLTNMHERYLYPIFPLLTILIFLPKPKFTLKSIVILSIIHFLNLYNLWFYPLILPLKTILTASNFIFCRVLSFILIVIYLDYFIKYLKSEE